MDLTEKNVLQYHFLNLVNNTLPKQTVRTTSQTALIINGDIDEISEISRQNFQEDNKKEKMVKLRTSNTDKRKVSPAIK